jgi:hypothetical protein
MKGEYDYGGPTKLEMRWKATPKEVGEWVIKSKAPGYPRVRTQWEVANEDVTDAAPGNLDAIAASRILNANLLVDSSHALPPPVNALSLPTVLGAKPGRKRARKESEVKDCTVKPKWSMKDINEPTQFWSGQYTHLRQECEVHGLSQTGTLKEMLERVRAHYQKPHPKVARKARTKSVSDFFKPGGLFGAPI